MATLLIAGTTNTYTIAGTLAEGNISVYKGGRLNTTITGTAPVDEEALLVCNEQCKLKSTGVSIVGAPGTELAVKSEQKQFNLLLKKGRVEFILSGTVGKMGFYTADRQYATADVIHNASTASSPVRGYMEATPSEGTRIGVYEGRLVFNTAEGAKTVDSNNYIVLAQANLGSTPSREANADEETTPWRCNGNNMGMLCQTEGEEDWYCDNENIGKRCNYKAGSRWGGKKFAVASFGGVAAAVGFGAQRYFDDDRNPNPARRTPSASAND